MTAAPDEVAIHPGRHLGSISGSRFHHHDWILREASNSETGSSASWFECGACGQPYA